jgi:hypothetical protein
LVKRSEQCFQLPLVSDIFPQLTSSRCFNELLDSASANVHHQTSELKDVETPGLGFEL